MYFEDIAATRRVYSFEDGLEIKETAGNGKKLGPAKSVESFGDSRLLNIESHDDFQSYMSSETALVDKNPHISIEALMSTIGNDKKSFGIYVHIYTRDEHGRLLNKNTNPHVHIETLDNKKICKVNIAGECPRTSKDMWKCVFDITGKKNTLPDGILAKILNWANYVRTTHRGKIKNWDCSRLMWVKLVEEVEKNKRG